jgi:serine/threonine-protein kinase
MANDLAAGTELAGYTIDAVVGRGGMGVVHRARQHAPERWVALKVINPAFADDPAFRGRFTRETAAAAAIDHPHILPVYEAGEAGGVLFIAMRYVDGVELRELLHDGPLEPARVASIAAQVGGALDAAHARGLVHRDVKPGNILVVRDAEAEEPDFCYLTDFGVSMWTTSSDGTLTAEGTMVGSLSYVSPEQILGDAVDGRADVYSLGCVLYECLTGRPPFAGRGPAGTMHAHLNESPRPPSSIDPGLPEAVDTVVARAMAKRPDERFASGRDVAGALREAIAGRPVPDVGHAAAGRRRLARTVLLAVVVVAAVAAAVTALLANREPDGSPSVPSAPLIRSGVHVTATSTAPSSTDASGNVVTYAPANVVDGSFDTAWRTPGDGRGEALTLVFDMPIDVVRIGLMPGYAKTDPGTGVNRFEQNRIITQVRYVAPGLEPIVQTFRPEPVPQLIRLDTTTRRITIQIVATTEPGGGSTFDYTAISEVYVYGFPQ